MILDAFFLALCAHAAWNGWRKGLAGAISGLGGMVAIVLLARLGSKGFTAFALLGIPWPVSYGAGVGFALSLSFLLLLERFIAGSFAGDAISGTRLPPVASRFLGSLFAISRRCVLLVAVLGVTLLLARPAVKAPSLLATHLSWETSRVGSMLLLRNPLDPEPFPRAALFQSLAGVGVQDLNPVQLEMVNSISRIDASQYLMQNRELLEAAARGDWRPLRLAPETPFLLMDPFFLQAAWIFEDPDSALGWAEP